jgi:excisionase family DNA binding protein
LVATPEAAQLLDISERTLRQMVARHEVPFLRIGRRVTFSVAALEQWVAERLEQPA